MCLFHPLLWMEGEIHSHKLLVWGHGLRLELTLHPWSEKLKMRTFSFEVVPG